MAIRTTPCPSRRFLEGTTMKHTSLALLAASFLSFPLQAQIAGSCTSTGGGCGGLILTCGAPPRVGGLLTATLSGLPAVGLGTAIVRIGTTVPGTPLGAPFALGCQNYMGPAPTLSLPLTFAPNTVYVLSIPQAPAFAGLPIAMQGLALDIPIFTTYSSNAIDAIVGS